MLIRVTKQLNDFMIAGIIFFFTMRIYILNNQDVFPVKFNENCQQVLKPGEGIRSDWQQTSKIPFKSSMNILYIPAGFVCYIFYAIGLDYRRE